MKASFLLRKAIKHVEEGLYKKAVGRLFFDREYPEALPSYCAVGAILHEAGVPDGKLLNQRLAGYIEDPIMDDIECLTTRSLSNGDFASVDWSPGKVMTRRVEGLVAALNDSDRTWDDIATVLEKLDC